METSVSFCFITETSKQFIIQVYYPGLRNVSEFDFTNNVKDGHLQRVTIPEAAYVLPLRKYFLSGCTRQSLAEGDDTKGCICTICVVDLLLMGGMRSKHVEELNLM